MQLNSSTVALVTGGGSGLGGATARRLVADGHTEHACVDAITLRPTRTPDWLVEAIQAAESASG